MPGKSATKRSGQDTRNRILEAAILRFSEHSYEETTLRDIAGDVGVDVALVHRSFGSKERLFAETAKAAFQPGHALAAEDGNLSATLASRVLEPSLDRATRSVDPLDILIRSLSNPQAIPILREFTLKDVIEPLSVGLGEPALLRAALIAACLAGISIFRNVLVMEPLAGTSDADLQPLIAGLLRVAMGEVPAVREPPSR